MFIILMSESELENFTGLVPALVMLILIFSCGLYICLSEATLI